MRDDMRCWVYSHLSELFVAAPRRLEPLPPGAAENHPETRSAVEALGRALAGTGPEAVAIAQTRLFVNATGGVGAPPYASWYLDGALQGPSTVLVTEAYAGQCLAVAAQSGQPPDYIATELEFLHFLGRHQEAARLTDDHSALIAARDAETRFLEAHFFRWVPRFSRAIRHAAPGPVFAGVADVLDAFCLEGRVPACGRHETRMRRRDVALNGSFGSPGLCGSGPGRSTG
jgi:putative dimethyl sulfoxide reductase chaperone